MKSSQVWPLVLALGSNLTITGCGSQARIFQPMPLKQNAATMPRGTVGASRPSASEENVLYSFKAGYDGNLPFAGLVEKNGVLYGTTPLGGGGLHSIGFGTVFEVDGNTEKVIYSFRDSPDGAKPYSNLIADKEGALYGTTFAGGTNGVGTVFKLAPHRNKFTESVLYSFQDAPNDGADPAAGLIVDSSGALYGTTVYGGDGACNHGCGTVFKLQPVGAAYAESVIYSFKGGNDGSGPGGLVADNKNGFFGTAGGGSAQCSYGGCGIVFELTPHGKKYMQNVLHSFQGAPKDGRGPSGDLISDTEGALYGTTVSGGRGICPYGGCGTVFKLTPSRTGYAETILHSFKYGPNDGIAPWGGPFAGKKGVLYGTTTAGGRGLCNSGTCGTVFKLTPSGTRYTESVVYSFRGSPDDGEAPRSALIAGNTGVLYGTTELGGAKGHGTVFEVKP